MHIIQAHVHHSPVAIICVVKIVYLIHGLPWGNSLNVELMLIHSLAAFV